MKLQKLPQKQFNVTTLKEQENTDNSKWEKKLHGKLQVLWKQNLLIESTQSRVPENNDWDT